MIQISKFAKVILRQGVKSLMPYMHEFFEKHAQHLGLASDGADSPGSSNVSYQATIG